MFFFFYIYKFFFLNIVQIIFYIEYYNIFYIAHLTCCYIVFNFYLKYFKDIFHIFYINYYDIFNFMSHILLRMTIKIINKNEINQVINHIKIDCNIVVNF